MTKNQEKTQEIDYILVGYDRILQKSSNLSNILKHKKEFERVTGSKAWLYKEVV